MCNWGLVPTQGYILTTCCLEDCLWMLSLKGVGPLVRSWGEFRNTLGSLRPLSGLCSLGKVPKFYFFSFTWSTCNIFANNFPNCFQLFITFSKIFSLTFFQLFSKLFSTFS